MKKTLDNQSTSISKSNQGYIKPSTMKHAKNISDILENIQIKTTDSRVSLEYNSGDNNIKLGFCEFNIQNNIGIISEFYTSNINGKNKETLLDSDLPWISEINILEEPIENIGKELFKNTIDLFIKKGVKTVSLIYSKETNAKIFYQKMCDQFKLEISSMSEPMAGCLIIKLK